MRILRIALENLNSLRGSHEVRLDQEPLDGAGLFAITGPTGAGKSTLLDAVTLALYGRAARYGSTASPADVMSRHCGICSAEVDFEVSGKRYRAVWSLRRARGKPDGAVQPAQRYIYDDDDRPLTQKIVESERKIESLIGLDYPRFLRSVLLAQGEFAQFLKAKPSERAELLESLTGTDIYSELGILAHTTAVEARNRMLLAESQTDQITVLDAEERAGLEAQLAANERERTNLENEIQTGAAVIERIGRLREAVRQEHEASTELERIEQEDAERTEERNRYERHLLVEPALEQLARVDSAQAHAGSAEAERRRAEDALLAARARLHQSATAYATIIERELRSATSDEAEAANAVNDAEKRLAEVERALQSNRADQPLFDAYPDITESLSRLRGARQLLALRRAEWATACEEAGAPTPNRAPDGSVQTEADGVQTLLTRATADEMIAKAHTAADRCVADAEKARAAAVEQARLARHHLRSAQLVADLSQHRAHLEPERPCPLCGSTTHPWAEHLPEEFTLTDLAANLESCEDAVGRSEHELRRVTGAQKKLDGAGSALIQAIDSQDAASRNSAESLEPLGLSLPDEGTEDHFLAELRARAARYRELSDERNTLQTRLRETRTERERYARTIAELTEAATDPQRAIDELGRTGATIPETAEAPVLEAATFADARSSFQSAVQELRTAEVMAAQRTQDVELATRRAAEERERLLPAVTAAGFDTIDAMREARMPDAEVKRFAEWSRAVEKRRQSGETLLHRAASERRALEEAGTPRGDAADAALREQTERTDRRDQLIQERTTIHSRIDDDNENRILREQRMQELENIRREHTVRAELARLIGSHDGSKFRAFAQSISLDVLTRHANRHLSQLSDRYRMVRHGGAELALEIEDLHQAATRRPMESLSGGESFLASLALALGLSDLAGRSVRIDSLFIDEGFGSLDPDTLDVAISALESLRQNRKTVGVISHVGLLKERIGTQIVVEKLAGGVSRLRVVG